MSYYLFGLLIFLATYTLNMLYISASYHRGLAHKSVTLSPWLERFVMRTGNWVTGLDPKAWVCMHRLHHQHSDTDRDPHSPVPKGIWSVFLQQLYSYNRILSGLIYRKQKYTSVVSDISYPVNWLNRKRVWYLPYALHGVLAILIGIVFQTWWVPFGYWLGMMSHPIQGWMVNALAHRFGYRNFDIPDNSRNNLFVAWLVFGEGYQNNHHFKPHSATFASRAWEIDLGFILCRALSTIRCLKVTVSPKS